MIKTVIKYSGKYKWMTLLATIIVIIAVVANILPFYFVYEIISPLIMGESIEVDFIVSRVIFVVVCLLINALLYIVGLAFSHVSAFNTLANMRKSLQKKLEKQPLGVIQDKGIGGLRRLFVDDIESIETLLAHAIPEGFANLLVPIGVVLAMFLVSWQLALLTLAVMPIGLFAMYMMTKSGMSKMGAYYQSAQTMNNTIIEYVNGMEVVKVFNRSSDSFKKYKNDVLSYRNFTLDWYKACWPWMALYAAIFGICCLFTLPFGGLLVINNYIELPKLILVLVLSFSIGNPIMKAMKFIPSLAQLSRKINEIEGQMNGTPIKTNNNDFTGKNLTTNFENVSFSYEDEEVIHNVSLTIKEGTKTALVGESGSGKSTLAKLLVHYYDISSGNIKVGGQDITDMSIEALSSKISFVSQDQFLFNTSIYENIKIGNPNATKEEVLAAANKAQCMEFINRLQNGIDTLAGDCGNQLSGGERQRVSIARAILKNSPIVVLDEATAFTDPENEGKLEAAISEVVKGKTLLVIAHKIPSIIDADCIFVMDKGNLIGQGTHGELLKSNETYKKLWDCSIKSMDWKVDIKEEKANA